MSGVPDGWEGGRTAGAGLHGSALAALGSLYLLAAGAYLSAAFALRLEPQVPLAALAILALAYRLAIGGLSAHPHPRFGAANIATAIRAALAALVAAITVCADGLSRGGPLLAFLIVLAALALALDGIDGYLARRFARVSDFGARFDMETDAFLILVLSLAALVLGKAGPWVVAIGLMRYAFVACQRLEPRLGAPLPPSFRRKLVCVVQVVALLVLLLPVIGPPVSDAIAAAALLALCFSFGADCLYLLRRPADSR